MKAKFMKFMNHQITVKDTIIYAVINIIIYVIIMLPIIVCMSLNIHQCDDSAKLESDDESDDDIDKVIE